MKKRSYLYAGKRVSNSQRKVPAQWISKARTICTWPLTVKSLTNHENICPSSSPSRKCTQTVLEILLKSLLEVRIHFPWMWPLSRARCRVLMITPEGWVEVEVEVEDGVEVQILRPLQVAKPSVCSLTSCESEVLTSITLHSINGTTYPSKKELPTGTSCFRSHNPAPHI